MSDLLSVLSKATRAIGRVQLYLTLGCALASYLFFSEAGRLESKEIQRPAQVIRPGEEAGWDHQQTSHLISALRISGISFAGLALLQLAIFIEHFKLARQIKKIRSSENPPV